MTKGVILFSFLFSMIFLSGCVPHATRFTPVDNVVSPPFHNKGIDRLAILIKNGDQYEKRQIESGALQALIAHNYIISSRADLKSLVKEIKFQNSGFSDSDSAEFGKIINVPAVLVLGFEKSSGRVGQFSRYIYSGGEVAYSLNARLIDVETGEVLYIARGEDNDLEKLAFSLSFEIPPSPGVSPKIKDPETNQARDVEKGDWERINVISTPKKNYSKYNKVAVLVDSGKKEFRNKAEDFFMMDLMKVGKTVPSRSDLNSVIKEIKFQQSDISDNTSVRLGKILNAQAVVLVSVKEDRRRSCSRPDKSAGACLDLGIMVKVIEVETGEIIMAGGLFEDSLEKVIYDSYEDKMLKSLSSNVASIFSSI